MVRASGDSFLDVEKKGPCISCALLVVGLIIDVFIVKGWLDGDAPRLSIGALMIYPGAGILIGRFLEKLAEKSNKNDE